MWECLFARVADPTGVFSHVEASEHWLKRAKLVDRGPVWVFRSIRDRASCRGSAGKRGARWRQRFLNS